MSFVGMTGQMLLRLLKFIEDLQAKKYTMVIDSNV